MLHRLDLLGAVDATTATAATASAADADLRSRLPRPEAAKEPPIADVQAILADVRARGDAAVRDYTARFDGVPANTLEAEGLRVPQAELDAALADTPPLLREALEV